MCLWLSYKKEVWKKLRTCFLKNLKNVYGTDKISDNVSDI
jgi:hypothetical protein